jgi:hypothetical protein
MKKILKPILLLLPIAVSYQTAAQVGFSISPNFGYGNTSVYNKEDTKGYKHTNGYINPLPMVASYKPSYGIDIGLSWQRENTGLLGIYNGYSNMPFLAIN